MSSLQSSELHSEAGKQKHSEYSLQAVNRFSVKQTLIIYRPPGCKLFSLFRKRYGPKKNPMIERIFIRYVLTWLFLECHISSSIIIHIVYKMQFCSLIVQKPNKQINECRPTIV